MAKPLVYMVLGCKGSDQFRVLADLIEFGTGKDEKSFVYYSPRDASDVETDFSVKHREAKASSYEFAEGVLSLSVPEEADLAFVVVDGLGDPADFVEAFHTWLPESGCELGRIITVLHSDLAVAKHEAFEWFECCIHFSDVVLLAKRDNVSNKQMKAFLDHYEEECYPCLFEYVKKGRVANPSLVLDIVPRRITRIFDEPEVFEDDEEEEIEEEEVAGDPTHDVFLKRISGGRRARVLPKIGEHL